MVNVFFYCQYTNVCTRSTLVFTAAGIPRLSPIQVIIEPYAAQLLRSDKIWHIQATNFFSCHLNCILKIKLKEFSLLTLIFYLFIFRIVCEMAAAPVGSRPGSVRLCVGECKPELKTQSIQHYSFVVCVHSHNTVFYPVKMFLNACLVCCSHCVAKHNSWM